MAPSRQQVAAAAGFGAAAGLAYWWMQKRSKSNALLALLLDGGPGDQAVIEVRGRWADSPPDSNEDDAVDIPAGLLIECLILRKALVDQLGIRDDELIAWLVERRNTDGPLAVIDATSMPGLDIAALAQLTYWYDRRPRESYVAEDGSTQERAVHARFGRWTSKVSREKVIYGAVALSNELRGHLGQPIFHRPAGIDVTRLRTLKRAAEGAGHESLLSVVMKVMNDLKPENCVRIPMAEIEKHSSKESCWLLIDNKVYDVTAFLSVHPGGEQLIVEAAGGQDATSMFELTHGEGLRYSLRLLNQFFIGFAADDCHGAPRVDPNEPTEDFMTILRSITNALHTFDEAKATGEAQGLIKR